MTQSEAQAYLRDIARKAESEPRAPRTVSKKRHGFDNMLKPRVTRRLGWTVVTVGVDVPSQRTAGIMAAAAVRQRDRIWATLCDMLPTWSTGSYHDSKRYEITRLRLVRVGPRKLFNHDNLPWALGTPLDAVTTWVEYGIRVCMWDSQQRRQMMGASDDKLVKWDGGIHNRITVCPPRNVTYDNPKLQGVEIWLWTNGHSTPHPRRTRRTAWQRLQRKLVRRAQRISGRSARS